MVLTKSFAMAGMLSAGCVLFFLGSAAAADAMGEAATYKTPLFSLLMNRKSPVDGINHYQKAFDQAFDAMLEQSTLAKAAKTEVPLKVRLLSGPEPEAAAVRDGGSGRQYVFFQACQAHACDDTKLTLLYAPTSNVMLARLHLDGKDEYLGHPSATERALLDRIPQPSEARSDALIGEVKPLEKIMRTLANNQSFRMRSVEFDKLVAPYCKKTYSDVDGGDTVAEYSCDKESGITQIKIDARGNVKPAESYMMSVLMFLSWDSYAPLKIQMERQLGRAQKSGKDYLAWKYTSDKRLTEMGSPVIYLSRDLADKSATFQLGLEQGP